MAERLRRAGVVNVGREERVASLIGGAGLALLAARQKGLGGAVLGLAGAALLARGATGHCFVYDALERDTSQGRRGERGSAVDAAEGVSVSASVTVARQPAEAYALWRDFTLAPRYMERVTRVEVLGPTHSRWTASGPLGRSWSWESEVVEDRPGELIAWESLPGSELPNRGWVQFSASGRAGHCEVRYFVEFDPPGGVVGAAIASAFHDAPREMIRGDLRRFKQWAVAQGASGEAAHSAEDAAAPAGGDAA